MTAATDPYSGYVNQIVQAISTWAIKDALWGISNLMHSFGDATEPDFTALVPIYNRVLAISLLVLGAVVAFGIIERIFGGEHGLALSVVPRVIGCVFFAYSGLAIVQYATVHAALLGHAWDKELAAASPDAMVSAGSVDPSQIHLNVVALILMALLVSFLALVVYLELIVRAALVLTITAFVPLVCVLAIWPRLAGGALHLAEFVIGLLLSKFVVATAFVVGLSLLLPAVLGVAPHNGKADWMASGFAILLITAISPVALFQGIKFAHGTAGTVARGWGGTAAYMLPIGLATRRVGGLLTPWVGSAGRRAGRAIGAGVRRLNRLRGQAGEEAGH
ncbi:MAG TPA: hypothetical protein VMW11_07705 [Candidatus Dormibacteraeota bacterium]|nr:hypothetical protein [Candidatus Dormibacteraeota bacterium]